ncbi:alpha beta hydrolase fold family [Fusarium mundagurra]|uniref:Alpha beta hydrolase fold family n=1 Tax=Fusarium mundagurra TaxID=1567541 RepID=A0A8H5XMR3_9HYPO|nr:alpha beta hydrolase fold family [Fusarium mundagurra]
MDSQTFSYTVPSGSTLHYLQSGNPTGVLVICLHGLGGSTATYEPLLPFIPKRFRTILVDFPGHGKSPLPPHNTISIGDHVSHLDHLIAHLQGDDQKAVKPKLLLIGHSLGAAVAMQYAAQAPDLVAGLVLIAPIQSGAKIPPFRERMLELAANTRNHGISFAADLAVQTNFPTNDQLLINATHRKVVRSIVASTDPEGYAQTCEAIVGLDHENPDYRKIICPALLIAGDGDIISPVARSQGLKDQLGGESSVKVVNSGHQVILEDVETVASSVLGLLDRANV